MATVLARGYMRLGSSVDPLRTKVYAEEFTEDGWIDSTGTQAFVVPSGTVGGGFLRGQTANAKVFRGSASTRIPRVVALDEVTPWWTSFGFRVNSGITTGDWCLMGMSDPSSLVTAAVGLYGPGPGGVTKFAGYTYNGANEDDTQSTISVDGGIHEAEIWFDETSFWMSVDDEAARQMTHTHLFAGTAVAPCWLSNGANTARSSDVFWRAAIWPVSYTV
jgi:hypothetical protein